MKRIRGLQYVLLECLELHSAYLWSDGLETSANFEEGERDLVRGVADHKEEAVHREWSCSGFRPRLLICVNRKETDGIIINIVIQRAEVRNGSNPSIPLNKSKGLWHTGSWPC